MRIALILSISWRAINIRHSDFHVQKRDSFSIAIPVHVHTEERNERHLDPHAPAPQLRAYSLWAQMEVSVDKVIGN